MKTETHVTLEAIAQRILAIPTLETRKSDGLDFHDVAVWSVREALEHAFNAGRASAGATPEPETFTCPECGEADHDLLVWDDDERITCQSCGTIIDPR